MITIILKSISCKKEANTVLKEALIKEFNRPKEAVENTKGIII